jgi:hypothetical protein
MIVDVTTYYPLKKGHDGRLISGKNGEAFEKGESYSFSQLAEAGSTIPFCHPEKMHKTHASLQRGGRIMHLHEHQWTLLVVEQIESRWDETRKMELLDNTEDGYCIVNYSCSEFEYVTQEFFYKFRREDEISTMSFNDVDGKIKADQMRPLVSPRGSFPAVWFGNQWEKTSDIPSPLCDKTKKALSSLVEKIKESSAFITASKIRNNLILCIKVLISFRSHTIASSLVGRHYRQRS